MAAPPWSLQVSGWLVPSSCGFNLGFDTGSLCFQMSLIDAVNLLFLTVYILSLAFSACTRQNQIRTSDRPLLCTLASPCCALLGVALLCSGAWFSPSASSRAELFTRGLVWVVVSVSLVVRPTRFSRVAAMAWWVVLAATTTAYSAEKVWKRSPMDVLDVASWVLSLILLLCAISVCRGVTVVGDHAGGEETQPLLTAAAGDQRPAAFGEASFLSRLIFTWMDPLLKLGYSRPLDSGDLPPLDADDAAAEASRKFMEKWQQQRRGQDAAGKPSSSLAVFMVLAECYKKDLLLTALYTLLRTLSFAASPLILYSFVSYSYQRDRRLAAGLALVGVLVAAKLVESLSQRHWFFGSRRLGMRMRSALMSAVFAKQLRLSTDARRRRSAGEVASLIAVDAYRLGEFPFWLHLAWCMPAQLALAVALLFWAVGRGALPGLAPLAACAVLNVPLAKALQRYQSMFMAAQDERQRATAEALNAVKVVKLQAWEGRFRAAVQRLRDAEVRWLAETQVKKAYGSALFWMAPTVVSAAIFAGTAALRTAPPLDAGVVFTILAALRVVSEPMRMLPEVLSVMIQVKVSLDRVAMFLTEDEFREDDVDMLPACNMMSVVVRNGVFSWDPSKAIATLKGIGVTAMQGEKVAVCGPVGAGKSSLLCAMLGEIPRMSGSVAVSSSVAYVAQTAWIQSGTVRDNVLFGKPMNNEEYEKAIRCCALDKDIENFPHGDLTEIGQRGLNMSGGQKQRIQLARAVYNDADIYFLDDPFSAVDAHTAATLFNDCVMGGLEKKTVILVTHQVEFLSKVDKILVMENGEITQEGTYQELLESGTAFEQLVNAHRDSKTTLGSQDTSTGGKQADTFQYQKPMIPQNSETEKSAGNLPSVQLTEEEKRELGEVGLKPYKDYVSISKGWFLLVLIIVAQCAFVFLQCLATYWLAVAVQSHQFGVAVVVGVYAAMATGSCLFAYVRSLLAAHFGLKASREFFSGFMDSVFKSPMLFFDSTPTGRIMTRASSDLSILDFDIPYTMTFVISGTIEVAATLVIMIMVTWQVVLVAVPVVIVLLYIQRYYIASARELVRINGTTKAPVMNHAAESMLGVITIRAFKVTTRFIQTNLELIDTDAALFFYTNAALEWVLLRVEALQILVIVTSSILLVSLPEGAVAPGFLGLCLSYALTLSSAQVFLTRFYSNLENYIISVERIKQFMHLPEEPPAVISDKRPPPSWPSKGTIHLETLRVKYRPNAPTVLHGITCTFAAGNKIGIVGRTGSGKTTLLSALFRLVDPSSGRILIDDIDICTIGLKDLRMKLSIIPQEPTLFRGSVRTNVDPLGLHTDEDIWEALDKCQLRKTISALPGLLESPVSDDGENWSAGQRQLFCLARVLLRRNKILVLDEATASIDSATDAILQSVIKEEFSGCTVITIAHRVPTVTDSDMVMVLSYGKMIEYDRPSRLMENKDSAFCKLVAEYWSNYS